MKNFNSYLLFIIICFGCNSVENSNREKEELIDQKQILIDSSKIEFIEEPILIEVPNKYKVVSLDYHNKWLQRIFVVSQREVISNRKDLRIIICELDSVYNFQNKTSVSFFTREEYATYLDELIRDLDEIKREEFIKYWRDEIYIGEFDCDSNRLAFNLRSTTHQKSIIDIEGCN